jgi:phospholipid-binding lipoprotein MlaA
MSAVNARANAEGSLKFINEAALDKYVFTRESFLQWRKNLENDGKVSSTIDDDLMLTEEKSVTGLNLRLNNYKQFEIAAKSFGSVAQKFDLAAQNFEQATRKIEHLKHR